MALLQANMVKNGIGVTELKLEASANESFIIKNVYVKSTGAFDYATIYVGTATRGYFRVGAGGVGGHLFFPLSYHKNILSELYQRKIFTGYPVNTGTKFVVKTKYLANICIIYDRYSPGDIKDDAPNGENAKEFTYLVYGQPSATITTSGTYKIDKNNNPDELPMFPFESEAPSGEMIIHGICFSPRARTLDTVGKYAITKYLKVMHGEKNFFDEDKNGFIAYAAVPQTPNTFQCGPGVCVGGDGTYPHVESPLFLTQPLVFKNGESLDAYWTVETGTGGTFAPEHLEITYIVTRKIK